MNCRKKTKWLWRVRVRLALFVASELNVAEVFTGSPGVFVKLEDTIRGFKGIVVR